MMTRQLSSSESESSGNIEAQLTQEERFNQKILEAEEMAQNDRVDEAIDILRLLMEKINFLKQNKKEYDKKMELICIYNLAAAYQKQWSLDDCIPLLEKFIALVKINLQESLKSSGVLNISDITSNKHWFKLKTLLIRALLQYCAVLSQIGEHKKALRTATDITAELKALFQRGYDECSKQIVKREAAQAKRGLGKARKTGVDKIQFSFSVLLSARDILQELAKIKTYSQIIDNKELQADMKEVKSKIYYWQSIPENNIKTLRKSFNNIEDPEELRKKNERNLLGIKRNRDWIEQFTIAKVMFMTPLNYLEFIDNDNLIFEFNHRNLMEKIFLLSVAYFSLSIEFRFLEDTTAHEKKKGKHDKKESEENAGLQRSEMFHLKSIEIVCQHIKENSAFVNHLVFNYHKHYKNNLITIQEENSLAEYSELYDIKNQQNKMEEEVLESCNMLILPDSKRYRKDSIYYEEEPMPLTQENKEEQPIITFKKPRNKEVTRIHDEKLDLESKLKSSTSFSRREDIGSKDKTLRKMGSAKMIALGKYELQQIDKNDKSESYKQISMRNIKDKDKSLSRSKNYLKNSMTLRQNKSNSPNKDRRSKHRQFRDLKESGDLRKDFTKKRSPEKPRPLDLLKKSGSLNDFTGKTLKESGHLYTSPANPMKKKR